MHTQSTKHATMPRFLELWALHMHLIKALKLFKCPQSALHEWSGLAMALAVYALLEPNALMFQWTQVRP